MLAPSRATLTPLGPVLRTPAFYLLLVGSVCSIGAVGGTIQNLKLYLSLDRHYDQGTIAQVLSLVLLCSLIGRVLMGYLADRLSRQRVMLLIYTLVAASIPLLFVAHGLPGLYLFAFTFGVGLGGDYMIIPLMAADLFGVQSLGRLMGIVLTADNISEAVVPMLVAGIRDRTGSYGQGFTVLVVLAARRCLRRVDAAEAGKWQGLSARGPGAFGLRASGSSSRAVPLRCNPLCFSRQALAAHLRPRRGHVVLREHVGALPGRKARPVLQVREEAVPSPERSATRGQSGAVRGW